MRRGWINVITGRLPPYVRRACAGLLLDARSLPARLRDKARREEPWQTLHNVGGGDYRAAGALLLGQLIVLAGLAPEDRVLDIGCGTGRVAGPLADHLAQSGAYIGFDVSQAAIRTCRSAIGPKRPDFWFERLDLNNGEYNRGGALDEKAVRFPAADGSIDVALAFSVFSHMQAAPIVRYLDELRRVLAPGGRALLTAYLLDDARREAVARGEALQPFKPWRDGAWVIDPRHPERAIAHDREWFIQAAAVAGLTVAGEEHRGGWCAPATYDGFQDAVVLTPS